MNTNNPALTPPTSVNAPGAASAAPAPAAVPVPTVTPAPRRQPPAAAPAVPATPAPAAAVPAPQPQAAAVPAPAATTQTPSATPTTPPPSYWDRLRCLAREDKGKTSLVLLAVFLLVVLAVSITAATAKSTKTALSAYETEKARNEASELKTKVAELDVQIRGAKAAEEEAKRQLAAREDSVKQFQQQLAVKPATPADSSVEKLKAELEEVKKAALVRGNQPPRAEAVTTTSSTSTETRPAYKSTSSGQGSREVRKTGTKEQELLEGLTGENGKRAIVSRGTGRVFFEGQHPADGMPYVQIVSWANANGYRNFKLNDPKLHDELMQRYGGGKP